MLNHGYWRVYPPDVTALVGSDMANSETNSSITSKRRKIIVRLVLLSKGPYVADLKSKDIAPLLDPNHKPSDKDAVGLNGECVDLTKKSSDMGDVSAKH